MNILNKIQEIIKPKKSNIVSVHSPTILDGFLSEYRFGICVWYNFCELVTDILDEVTIEADTRGTNAYERFIDFKSFVYDLGRVVLQKIYDDGYCVVRYNKDARFFEIVPEQQLSKQTQNNITTISTYGDYYILKSTTFFTTTKSDRALCSGFIQMLDDVLNGSATVSKRLGAVVIASPKNISGAPAQVVLTEEDKKQLEKELATDYGMLRNQRQVMVLPREMSWQVVNLAGVDNKLAEKVKFAILGIADRLKLPANQIAMVEAQSNNALSAGGELEAGDALKYKTFKRLFERTFGDMARFYNIRIKWYLDFEKDGKVVNQE